MKHRYSPGDMVLVPDGYNAYGVAREWRETEVLEVRFSKATGNTLLKVRYLDDDTTTLVPHYAVRPAR